MEKCHLAVKIFRVHAQATKPRALLRRRCNLVVRQYGYRLVAFSQFGHDLEGACIKAYLQQDDIVLVLPHGGFALQRHRLADEFAQASQVLTFFVEE